MSKNFEKVLAKKICEEFPFSEVMKNCRHELENSSYMARQMNCFKRGAVWEHDRSQILVDYIKSLEIFTYSKAEAKKVLKEYENGKSLRKTKKKGS